MIFTKIIFPARHYLFKVSNRNTGIWCELFKVNNKDIRMTSPAFFVLLSFVELKPHCSVGYSKIVLCLFSKLTGKVEFFPMQQLPKNDVFLMYFLSLDDVF